MASRSYNVLFLCTGNTARSVLAESILRKEGAGRFQAFSAGSQPKGVVNPFAIKVLESYDYPTDGLRSKSWLEFAQPGAPVMDFVFTVCDSAAGEACPVWPGQPMTAHWGIEDPAAVEGTDIEKEAAFVEAFRFMKNRISAFTNLPLDSIDRMATERELRLIGRQVGATAFSLEAIDSDAADLRDALSAEHQPVEDLGEAGQHLFRVRRGGDVVGFGGYALHGDSALLRSVVVVPAQRGHGVGRSVIGLLLRKASGEGARNAFLLTETAVPFFEKLGFARIDRSVAPSAITSSRQASSLCRASAALMTRPLPV